MNSQEAQIFVTRFVQGNFSREDHQSFLEWIKGAPVDQIEALAREYETVEMPGLSTAGPSALWKQQLEQRIDALEAAGRVVPMQRRPAIRRWIQWAAAAVIIAGGATWLYLSNVKGTAAPEPVVQVPLKGIEPGGNKAVLTLSDGSTILLADASNGLLTQQGHTRITLVNNEALLYEPIDNNNDQALLYNTIATPRGGQYQLTLPDQTKVWLNAESSIRFPVAFAGNERRVQITGEVYFEVTKNPARPFKAVIGSGNGPGQSGRGRGEVEVVGTHFNIKAYNDEPNIETTLLKGSVKVAKGESIQVLKPGQQARMDTITGGNGIKIVNLADANEMVNWKEGYFTGPKISAIMSQISRWYDVKVEYESGKIPEGNFDGRLSRSTSIKSLLNTLRSNGIETVLDENERTIIVKS
ncbi:MAG: FecR domain-containing protein [Candidatus Pseudobacter hemicellulosilyticus]|uniref:FecR domain-containing protein n=1 Tax=Candidatus Pseudobacter hemicellulosilyticus TaxID=3121375 RepID=A0AAJ5WN94_9BACT|nr:MAG: FecR domain-containing protein [Pseudobacter sp.]